MRVVVSREITEFFFLDSIKKISVGMHSDVCELVWFKLDIVIDASEPCILILNNRL